MNALTFSFDIGYASIGWSVIEAPAERDQAPLVRGAGVVLFPADDCLASTRRTNRRMRRTIRARRQRIERMRRLFAMVGVLDEEILRRPGHPVPFYLAARALQGYQRLSALEAWQVLLWYAHNRGYDGNAAWSRVKSEDSDDEATEAEEDALRAEAAKAAMKQYGTTSMAETVTAFLGLDPKSPSATLSFKSPKYRAQNWAFPRGVVEAEVRRVLEASDLPSELVGLILDPVAQHRERLAEAGVRFPLRYVGSVLFGQLIPRFDNRIIARCPITWVSEYRRALSDGLDEAAARHRAEKYAKVPNADCPEFYAYRFARTLANVRVDGRPLTAEQRRALMERGMREGRFSKRSFRAAVKEVVGEMTHSNLTNYFELTEQADKALVLVPDAGHAASGRAPYARPVLRRVTEEVLRGEDPTRPARSAVHPDGEDKESDGVLYCLADPNSEVNRFLASRSLDHQTNNPLVRHRLLIFTRLLDEMVQFYAGGKADAVGRCCIEVGRELSKYAGLTNKEISRLESEKMADFNKAVKYLEKNLPGVPLSAKLIKKCRIAMDLGWRCPFTGLEYAASDLSRLELEHVVPFSSRRTNSMAALVLTFPEVNKMKSNRTGLQFIRECGGQPVKGRENLCLLTPKEYEKRVKALKVRGSESDKRRCAMRRKLMMVESYDPEKESVPGFTEGMMTQSSHLMRLAAQLVRRRMSGTTVTMIPGQVTAELRKSWKLMGALAPVCPAVLNEAHELRTKEEIRSLTHLHHAIDAAVLGLVPVLIPQGTNGRIWQALVKRKLSMEDESLLRESLNRRIYRVHDSKLYLENVPQETLDSLALALGEKRVVQHVPADMSGSLFDQNYRRIMRVEGDKVILRRRLAASDGNEAQSAVKPQFVEEEKSLDKIVGLGPNSKLKAMKAALVINTNYGIALDPKPCMIRHHRVFKQLLELRRENGGKPVRLLRRGDTILLEAYPKDSSKQGMWRVASVKSVSFGLALDLQRPESALPLAKKDSGNWKNVLLSSLLSRGMKLMPRRYLGFPARNK